ncbi:T9SS type A sorting domain-containing protein, partial [Crocinitomix catalasitica]|nr:T9SS type A sorting domain-containing protein [Crocinitomix catalasitica]
TTTKTCTITPDANSTYFWNFGDGFTSTAQGAIVHTYTIAGLYTVSLTVTDLFGCSASFSETVDVGCLILPIELVSFDGTYNRENVNLSWKTSSEINNDYFTVEKSLNGHDFTFLAEVNAAGNSAAVNTYGAIDPRPSIGVNYYRLKQTDFDGNYHYSKPISINVINNNETFKVFPNPTQHSAEVFFNSVSEDETEIKIIDASGRVVFSQTINSTIGTNRIDLNTAEFAEGVYFLTLTNKFEMLGTKFVKE